MNKKYSSTVFIGFLASSAFLLRDMFVIPQLFGQSALAMPLYHWCLTCKVAAASHQTVSLIHCTTIPSLLSQYDNSISNQVHGVES